MPANLSAQLTGPRLKRSRMQRTVDDVRVTTTRPCGRCLQTTGLAHRPLITCGGKCSAAAALDRPLPVKLSHQPPIRAMQISGSKPGVPEVPGLCHSTWSHAGHGEEMARVNSFLT